MNPAQKILAQLETVKLRLDNIRSVIIEDSWNNNALGHCVFCDCIFDPKKFHTIEEYEEFVKLHIDAHIEQKLSEKHSYASTQENSDTKEMTIQNIDTTKAEMQQLFSEKIEVLKTVDDLMLKIAIEKEFRKKLVEIAARSEQVNQKEKHRMYFWR